MSSNYPPGAEYDMNAPYNQEEPNPVDVDVQAYITLTKTATVAVTDYNATNWEDWEVDDDGRTVHSGGTDYDFSETDFKEAFETQEFNIPELLSILKLYAEADIDGSFHTEGRKAESILKACDAWEVDEFDVEEME